MLVVGWLEGIGEVYGGCMVGFVVWEWVVLLFTIHSKERVVLLLSVLSLFAWCNEVC